MDLSPVFDAPLSVKTHLAAALLALVFGAAIFANVKGTSLHRIMGWAYVTFISITALTAVFIRRGEGIANIAGFTPVHLFVVLTAATLPLALIRIRKGDVKGHAQAMIGLYVGAIIIAGLLAFLPGRILNRVFFGG